MIDNSSLSVQAEINSIETKETAHQLSGMDSLGLDISQIPPPSETEENNSKMKKYMSCICETACFPVNYKDPMLRHSLQLWKECGQQSCKALNGYRLLNVVNGLGRIRDSHCWDCLGQSEAFPPLSPGRSTVKPGA